MVPGSPNGQRSICRYATGCRGLPRGSPRRFVEAAITKHDDVAGLR